MATRKTNTAASAGERARASDASVRERAEGARAEFQSRARAHAQEDLQLISRSVEQQLLDLNRRYESALFTYDCAAGLKDEGANSPHVRTYDLVKEHAQREMREVWNIVIALPANTFLATALKARIIAVEAEEWWSDKQCDLSITGCRALIDNLLGAAGLSRMKRLGETSMSELQSWLREPEKSPFAPRPQQVA